MEDELEAVSMLMSIGIMGMWIWRLGGETIWGKLLLTNAEGKDSDGEPRLHGHQECVKDKPMLRSCEQ